MTPEAAVLADGTAALDEPPPRTAAWLAFLCFLALLAVSVWPMGPSEWKFHLLELVAAAAAVLLLAAGAIGAPPRAARLPFALLTLWALGSALWAPDPQRALAAFLWSSVLVLAVAVGYRFGASFLPAASAAFLLVALPVLLYGLLQYGGLRPHTDWANPLRLAGPFVNSNIYGAFAGTALLTALGLLFSKPLRPAGQAPVRGWASRFLLPLLGLVALPLAAVSLALTASRGAWIATACGLATLALLAVRFHPRRALVGTALLAFVLGTGAGATMAFQRGLLEGVRARLAGAGRYSLEHREAIWLGTLGLIRARPLGVGLGSFEPAFPPHRVHSDRFVVNFAHADALELVAVLGIPASVLLLALITQLRRERPRALLQHPCTWGSAAILTSLAAQSLFDFPLRKPTLGLFAACLAGALLGGRGGARRAHAAPVLVAWAALLPMAASYGYGELLRLEAERLEASGAFNRAAEAYARADRAFVPRSYTVARSAGAMNARLVRLPAVGSAFLSRSERWYTIAIERNPADAPSQLAKALLAKGMGRKVEARAHFLRAVELDPMDSMTVLAVADYLAKLGDQAAALRLLARGMDLKPGPVPKASVAAAAAPFPAELTAGAIPATSTESAATADALAEQGLSLAAALVRSRHAARWPR